VEESSEEIGQAREIHRGLSITYRGDRQLSTPKNFDVTVFSADAKVA
jgi:hypothetical protein